MIERIEALIEKATASPWEVYDQAADEGWNYEQCSVSSKGDRDADWVAQDVHRNADAAFIAHARQLLPLMLEVVKAEDANHLAHGRIIDRYDAAPDILERAHETSRAADAARNNLSVYCSEYLPEKEEK